MTLRYSVSANCAQYFDRNVNMNEGNQKINTINASPSVEEPPQPTDTPSQRWADPTKRIVASVILLLLIIITYTFRHLLPPLAIATLLAFILDPIVDFFEERTNISRSLVTTLLFLILIAAVMGVLAAPVTAVASIRRLILSLQFDLNQIINDIGAFFNQPVEIWEYQLDLSYVYTELSEMLRRLVGSAAEGALDFVLFAASGAIGLVFWLIFTLIAAYYLVRDGDRIVGQLDDLAPPGYRDDIVYLRRQITGVWNAFLRGQLVLGSAIAAVVAIVDLSIGLPYSWALGLLAGVMEFVPYIGPFIAAIPAVLLALIQGSSYIPLSNFWFAVLVAGVYTMIQQVENNFFVPRIMGRRLDLHPLVVMIAVLAGGQIGGIMGIFLAAPTLATFRVLGNYILCRLYDRDPFVEPEEVKVTEPPSPVPQPSLLKQAGEVAVERLQEKVGDAVGKYIKHTESADADEG